MPDTVRDAYVREPPPDADRLRARNRVILIAAGLSSKQADAVLAAEVAQEP